MAVLMKNVTPGLTRFSSVLYWFSGEQTTVSAGTFQLFIEAAAKKSWKKEQKETLQHFKL